VQITVDRSLVRAEESWAEAADRALAASGGPASGPASGPVLAADLSGDPLRFRTDPERRFAFRAMTAADLTDLVRWINLPHVAQWWDDQRTPEQVAAYYGPGLRGEDPVRLWIAEVNGRSIGFFQDYRIADHPDYALLCGSPDAVGFDYVIGEPAYVDRGLGTSLLWVFLRDIVAPAYDGVSELFAAPDHRNGRSLRVLEKLGATQGLWFDEPSADGGADTVIGCSIDVPRVLRHP
jgi:aminoglycoside 6'-N-acetyltransferase